MSKALFTNEQLEKIFARGMARGKEKGIPNAFCETYAQGFVEGYIEGYTEGYTKAMARMRLMEKADTLIQLITTRLGRTPGHMQQFIREADSQTLDGWIDRIAEGARPRDVIRH